MQNRTFEEFIERELLGVINDWLGNKILIIFFYNSQIRNRNLR